MIKVKRISKAFEGNHVINDVTLTINSKSITGIIGPNGAGKSTLFNIIAGLFPPDSGSIYLEDNDITYKEPHELFHLGLLRTFQISHEFPTLTVLENLMMVPNMQTGEKIVSSWLHRKKIKEEEHTIFNKAKEITDFLSIAHLNDELAGNLSGGQKKLLELGRVMMVDAKVVLLDEIGAGVNKSLLKKIGDVIVELNKNHGYTFCMIEHDMQFMARMCDNIFVMTEGSILTQGQTLDDLKKNEQVINAYLGKSK